MSVEPTSSDVVGVVATLHRYPVKSLQGLGVDHLDVGCDAIAGDRELALIDEATGQLMSAKRYSRLLAASADDDSIELPDGRRFGVDDPELGPVLSDWLGRPVRLERASGATEVSYTMTFDPPDDDAEYYEIPSPKGTFLDLAAAHLVSTATLTGCANSRPDLDWDPRRFRPNIVVEGPADAFAEDGWCGRALHVGEVVLAARQPTVRCAMPLRAQPGLERQPALHHAMNDLHANHLGIYLDVITPGTVHRGDEVRLGDALVPS